MDSRIKLLDMSIMDDFVSGWLGGRRKEEGKFCRVVQWSIVNPPPAAKGETKLPYRGGGWGRASSSETSLVSYSSG